MAEEEARPGHGAMTTSSEFEGVPVSDLVDVRHELVKLAKRRRERHFTFLGFLLFSVLYIAFLVYLPPKFVGWRDWIPVAGAIFFPLMALLSWLSMRNDWSVEKEEQTIMRTLGYIVLAPVLLVVAIIVGLALYSAFGWFATIPSWAAVIIVLLLLKK
jgi:hypothetical protein